MLLLDDWQLQKHRNLFNNCRENWCKVGTKCSQSDKSQYKTALGNPLMHIGCNSSYQHTFSTPTTAMNHQRRGWTVREISLNLINNWKVGGILIENLRMSIDLFDFVQQTTIDAEGAVWNLKLAGVLFNNQIDFRRDGRLQSGKKLILLLLWRDRHFYNVFLSQLILELILNVRQSTIRFGLQSRLIALRRWAWMLNPYATLRELLTHQHSIVDFLLDNCREIRVSQLFRKYLNQIRQQWIQFLVNTRNALLFNLDWL